MNKNIIIVKHPFIEDSLTHLRDKNSSLPTFRRHSDRLCQILFTEAVKDLDMNEVEIETPIEKTTGKTLADNIVVVPILRAGLAMMFGAIQLLPKSKIGLAGLQRDENTAVADKYYWRLPKLDANSIVIITDPMLATGGTISQVIEEISKLNIKEIRVVSVIAAPEGLEKISKSFPNVKIFCGVIDKNLNSQKYIVPGLGDYGDRYFGTD